MNISDLQAGPDLDALIAEKVMGYKRVDPSPHNGWISLLSPDGLKAGGWDPGQPFRESQYWPGGELWACRLPKYSTEIAAAWEVLEKLKVIFLKVGVSNHFDVNGYVAHIGYNDGFGKTPSEAICRAALKAMEKIR